MCPFNQIFSTHLKLFFIKIMFRLLFILVSICLLQSAIISYLILSNQETTHQFLLLTKCTCYRPLPKFVKTTSLPSRLVSPMSNKWVCFADSSFVRTTRTSSIFRQMAACTVLRKIKLYFLSYWVENNNNNQCNQQTLCLLYLLALIFSGNDKKYCHVNYDIMLISLLLPYSLV